MSKSFLQKLFELPKIKSLLTICCIYLLWLKKSKIVIFLKSTTMLFATFIGVQKDY